MKKSTVKNRVVCRSVFAVLACLMLSLCTFLPFIGNRKAYAAEVDISPDFSINMPFEWTIYVKDYNDSINNQVFWANQTSFRFLRINGQFSFTLTSPKLNSSNQFYSNSVNISFYPLLANSIFLNMSDSNTDVFQMFTTFVNPDVSESYYPRLQCCFGLSALTSLFGEIYVYRDSFVSPVTNKTYDKASLMTPLYSSTYPYSKLLGISYYYGILFGIHTDKDSDISLPLYLFEFDSGAYFPFIIAPNYNYFPYSSNFSYSNYSQRYFSLAPYYVINDGSIAGADSYNTGYNSGYQSGYNSGYDDGKSDGETVGYKKGETVGYNNGYNKGIENANTYSFTGLFSAVIDAPVKVFTFMFNVEILGVNLSDFAISLLSICLLISVVRFLI